MTFNKRTGIIFLACAAMITCAIFACHAHQALNATNAQRARLVEQITSITTRIHTAESDLAQAKADWEDEQAATTDSDKAGIYDTLWGRRLSNSKDIEKAVAKRLSNDPKYQEIRRKQMLLDLERMYGQFIAKEHLAPDQAAKLKKALLEREMDRNDLKMALEAQDLSPIDPSGSVIKQQFDDTLRQAAEDILGPDAYARFDAYDRQKTLWDKMGNYAVRCTGMGSPVPFAQVEQLVGYIAQNNPDYQEGKAVNNGQIDWPAVNDYARTILTPDQFDLFKSFTANDVISQKLKRALAAIGEGGGAGNGGAENAGDAASR